MTLSADVLIVGAGIVGAACAFELAKAGLRVTVTEERFTSSGSTGASMGHVVVMDDGKGDEPTDAGQGRELHDYEELLASAEPVEFRIEQSSGR